MSASSRRQGGERDESGGGAAAAPLRARGPSKVEQSLFKASLFHFHPPVCSRCDMALCCHTSCDTLWLHRCVGQMALDRRMQTNSRS